MRVGMGMNMRFGIGMEMGMGMRNGYMPEVRTMGRLINRKDLRVDAAGGWG